MGEDGEQIEYELINRLCKVYLDVHVRRPEPQIQPTLSKYFRRTCDNAYIDNDYADPASSYNLLEPCV